jgi:light-regulated signal transduction histidine kinase (bacteriophytochrome)
MGNRPLNTDTAGRANVSGPALPLHTNLSGWDELELVCHALSHDLRAPLRAIDGSAKLLRDSLEDRLNTDEARRLQVLIQASQLEAQLLDELLLLCRIARTELTVKPVDITKMAATILNELSHDAPSRRKTFHVSPGMVAEGDPGLLEIALRHLLDNAWKFTQREEETEITVGAEERGGRITFYVRDNGVGFDAAYADKLFGIFERLSPPADFTGVGMGLAIVKKIIDRHGGAIWTWSELGKGATFWFTLSNDAA